MLSYEHRPATAVPEPARVPRATPSAGEALLRDLGNASVQCLAEAEELDDCGCGCGGQCGDGTPVQKLSVGPPRDRYEREADLTAARVVSGAAITAAIAPLHAAHGGPALAALPGGPGQALPAPLRGYMEPRFGHDFDAVRVHTGEAADLAAARLGARAFTAGRDIFLRGDESVHDPLLMAHELTHVVQQRGTPAAVQRAADPDLAEIEDLLSYGLLDWEITDADALQALQRLKRLPRAKRAVFFAEPKYARRLRAELTEDRVGELDELAQEAAGSTPPAATMTEIEGNLSYGPFDWAVTDRDAVRTLELLKGLTGPQLITALKTIDYQRLLENLPPSRRAELSWPGTLLTSVTFHGDVGLRPNAADWGASGDVREPEWQLTDRLEEVSVPTSETRNSPLQVEVGLDVVPYTAPPGPARLTGRGANPAFTFDYSGDLGGGRNRRLSMTSAGRLPDTVAALEDQQVVWELDWQGAKREIGRTTHTVYVTLGKPRDEKEVTVRRMRLAVKLAREVAESAGTLESHALVHGLMQNWTRYNLKVQYPSNEWLLADNPRLGAQCIDLVRFVNSVLGVLGAKGDARAVVVWAHPAQPRVPIESPWTREAGGLATSGAVPPAPGWWPGLLDGGRCWNNYEAALVLTDGGVTRYYPGGVDLSTDFTTPLQVLHVFQCLVWLTPVAQDVYDIQQVLATYRTGGCPTGRVTCHA